MNTVDSIDEDTCDWWRNGEGIAEAAITTFVAPPTMPTCGDCAAIITKTTEDEIVVRVPWTLSDTEVHQLMMGGTLWLSTWGGLPPHMLEVQPPAAYEAPGGADDDQTSGAD